MGTWYTVIQKKCPKKWEKNRIQCFFLWKIFYDSIFLADIADLISYFWKWPNPLKAYLFIANFFFFLSDFNNFVIPLNSFFGWPLINFPRPRYKGTLLRWHKSLLNQSMSSSYLKVRESNERFEIAQTEDARGALDNARGAGVFVAQIARESGAGRRRSHGWWSNNYNAKFWS